MHVEIQTLKGETRTETFEHLEGAMAFFVGYEGDGKETERLRLFSGAELMRFKYVGPEAKVFEE